MASPTDFHIGGVLEKRRLGGFLFSSSFYSSSSLYEHDLTWTLGQPFCLLVLFYGILTDLTMDGRIFLFQWID